MLDIASNRIKKIENISHLTELQEFWVSLIHEGLMTLQLPSEIPFTPALEAVAWNGTVGRAVGLWHPRGISGPATPQM